MMKTVSKSQNVCNKLKLLMKDHKLQASGISGYLYNLIVDYFSGRKQYVEVEGERSTEAEV